MKFQKYLTFLFLAIFSFNCSSPTIHKIVDTFDNGNVKSIAIFKGSSKIQKIEFLIDGNIVSRSFYKDNCLFGKWTSADSFGHITGLWKTSYYYGNGILKNQGYQNLEGKHGHWAHYSRNGDLESSRYYFYGEPVGDWYSYHNGHIEVKHYGYIKGNGSWTEYYNADLNILGENKLLKKETSFFNNKQLSGVYKYYYKDGSVKISGNYIDGKKDGKWNYYNEAGILIKEESYIRGALDGDFKLFFADGITEKLIGKYKNNKRIDTWFWFFSEDKKSNYKINYSE